MPKFNKPQINKSKVNKSKFDDRPNQTKPLLSESELLPVQLDETIVAGRRPKPLNDLQRLLAEIPELTGGFNPEMFAEFAESNPFNDKKFESKIRKILGTKNINSTRDNSIKYLEYLKQHIQFPCHVTGTEEFEWEEEYTMGFGSKKEYAKLKKTQPSYTDNFIINQVEDFALGEDGICARVQRVGDRKKFILLLAELKALDLVSPNHQLLHDYAVWWINY